jgi:predicted membrane protein
LYPPFWFLVYGILLFLAALKNRQSIAQLRAAPVVNIHWVIGIQEFSMLEAGFGLFMILFYILTKVESRILPQLSLENTIFFGTLFAAWFSIYCTLIAIMKMVRNKELIEAVMKKLS